jgi:anti-anti-sigma factor
MEIEEKTEGDVTTLLLKGRMVGGEGDNLLRDSVEDLIEAGRVNIILDMVGVPDIDSACLGEILHCHINVSRKGGKFKLVNLSEKLRGLLSRTRLAWVEEGDADDDTA